MPSCLGVDIATPICIKKCKNVFHLLTIAELNQELVSKKGFAKVHRGEYHTPARRRHQPQGSLQNFQMHSLAKFIFSTKCSNEFLLI